MGHFFVLCRHAAKIQAGRLPRGLEGLRVQHRSSDTMAGAYRHARDLPSTRPNSCSGWCDFCITTLAFPRTICCRRVGEALECATKPPRLIALVALRSDF